MKKLFAIVFAVLVAAAIWTQRSLPDASSDAPVLYWVTDGNPARTEQIRTFRSWLRKNGHPEIDLRIDAVNANPETVLIQGVSGVCAALVDHSGGSSMRFRKAVGILEDVTDAAQALGFDVSHTWKVMEPEITEDGRQYCFPCNVTCDMVWLNLEVFEKYGLKVPERHWTIDEFERLGREFVAKANTPGKLQRFFLICDVDTTILAHTMGGAIYNETQTAGAISRGDGFRRALAYRYKWTNVDHLIPSASERDSFSTSAGYGGSNTALFAQGNYALLASGRYILIQFRQFSDERKADGRPPLSLGVVAWPHGDMPCTTTYTRATGVYTGGRNQKLAHLFLAYLASEDYNMNIVRDADALPPNPKYTQTEEYLRPKDRPEEWGVHGPFVDTMNEDAVANEFSPFILDSVAERFRIETIDKYMNDKMSLDECVAHIDSLMEDEIRRSLAEEPEKRPLYEERCRTQAEIDAMRARGEKVPLSWITNPYWRKWYVHHGLADAAK